MEEYGFGHNRAAEEGELGDVICPLGWGAGDQIGIEGYGDALGGGAFAYAEAGPGGGLGVVLLPGGDVGVVDAVGRDEVAHFAQCVDLG